MFSKLGLLKDMMLSNQLSNQGFLRGLKDLLFDIKDPEDKEKVLDTIFKTKAEKYIALSASIFGSKYPSRFLAYLSDAKNKIDYLLTLFENGLEFDIRFYTPLILDIGTVKEVVRYAVDLKKSNLNNQEIGEELDKIFAVRGDAQLIFNRYLFSFPEINAMSYHDFAERLIEEDMVGYFLTNSKIEKIKDLVIFYHLFIANQDLKHSLFKKSLRDAISKLSQVKKEDIKESEFEDIIEISRTIGLASFVLMFQDRDNTSFLLKRYILSCLLKFYPASVQILQVYFDYLENFVTTDKSLELDREYFSYMGIESDDNETYLEDKNIKVPYKVYKKITVKKVDN